MHMRYCVLLLIVYVRTLICQGAIGKEGVQEQITMMHSRRWLFAYLVVQDLSVLLHGDHVSNTLSDRTIEPHCGKIVALHGRERKTPKKQQNVGEIEIGRGREGEKEAFFR